MIRQFTLAFAAPFALLAPVSASAAPSEQQSATVSYADLDLSNPRDAARLDRRIRAAADRVCDMGLPRPTREQSAFNACRSSAFAQARSEVEIVLAARAKGERLASAGKLTVSRSLD